MLSVPEPLPNVQTPNCPRGTFFGAGQFHAILGPAWCKSWSCPRCGPRKARALAKRIAQCPGTKLLTLTLPTDTSTTATQKLDYLNGSFRVLVKRLRRAYPASTIRYVKVVELTKNGTPHLHVVMESEYIPQHYISRLWHEITGAKVVDIRRIRRKNGSGRYLAKYLTKSEHHIHGRRRWSQSPGFLPANAHPRSALSLLVEKWYFQGATLEMMEELLTSLGYDHVEGENWSRAWETGPAPPWLLRQ